MYNISQNRWKKGHIEWGELIRIFEEQSGRETRTVRESVECM